MSSRESVLPAGREPLLLAIESSCDETAVAVLSGRGRLLAAEIASQAAIHRAYGGVVPEVASRNHSQNITPLYEEAMRKAGVGLDEIDAFAATSGPGLASSLMIGVAFAKGLALGRRKPYLAVNHLEGHLLSPFFGDPTGPRPSVGLVVSGGHTLLVKLEAAGQYAVLGQTVDDAAGEAFDKVGKLLGLPYPAGPVIDQLALDGDPKRFALPRSMIHSGDHQFSFSGLKTAVRYLLPKLEGDYLADLCASFQEAVVEVLVSKTVAAARCLCLQTIGVSGGVSGNSRLRRRFEEACEKENLELLLAARELSTDNAGMIAYAAMERFLAGENSVITTDIEPNLAIS